MSAARKILVVDDDPVVGKSFDRVLSSKGYAVITAANGEEALRKLATESYDAVFTDIRMPGMSGIDVAEKIKANTPWMPVVIVTGYDTESHRSRAAAAGVSEFLQKPLSPESIADSAEKAVHEHAAVAAPVTVAATVEEADGGVSAKDVALFFAAPFIGLFYIAAMPLVGAALLAWYGGKVLMTKAGLLSPTVKSIGMLVAAPFIGLGFIIAVPTVGTCALGYYALRAAWKD